MECREPLVVRTVTRPRRVEQRDDQTGMTSSDPAGRLDVFGGGLGLAHHHHQPEPVDVDADGDHVRR